MTLHIAEVSLSTLTPNLSNALDMKRFFDSFDGMDRVETKPRKEARH